MRPILPTQSYQDANAWINAYGEWGLAMECVIDWIGDLELTINRSQYMAIESAMSAMGWDQSSRMKWLRDVFMTQEASIEQDVDLNA